MTIKQILDCEESYAGSGDFKIDGASATQVTFVGQVRQVTPQSTHINYRLDDGTAVIEVKKWIDADKMQTSAEAERQPDLDSYVRVWGRLKSFNNKKHIGAHVIRPVADFNEVNYHLLEAAYVHLHFTRGPQGGQAANGGAAGGDDSMFVDGGYGGGGGAPAAMAHLSAQGQKLYNFLMRTPGGNEGVHVNLIASGTGLPERDVKVTMDELLGSGLVYTTLDDDTYAVLES